MRKDLRDLWQLAEPHVRDAGLDLVEVQFGREQTGWVLRLFVDRPWNPQTGSEPPAMGSVERSSTSPDADRPSSSAVGGGTVTHEDCERVSRDVSAALDVADSIPHAYQLEVSSPGLDRPLRRERDFERFLGESARIRLVDGVEGRRNFSGTLQAVKDGRVEIACDGRSYAISIDDIARANLVPNWEREFHRSESHDDGGSAGPDQGLDEKRSIS
jgi:ribosome maturation factor RimP